MLQKQFLGYY